MRITLNFLYMCIRGVQTRLWPAGPTNPPNLHPSSTWTDALIRRFWVSVPKAWCRRFEWRVFFSKTRATRPDKGYIQIRRNHAQIRGDPASSQPYLVRFSQIRPLPVDFSDFGANFDDFDANPVRFYIFRWWFADSGDDFAAQWQPDLHQNPKPTRPIDVDGQFQVALLSTHRWQVRFGLGQKLTRPNLWTPQMCIL